MRAVTRGLASAAGMLLLALATVSEATVPPVIEIGKKVAGKGGGPDIYHFIGTSGSRVTIQLETPGKALLTLYTPRGEEMLHASGTGSVELEAVLPLSHAFLVGVSRADASRAYTISLEASQPDLHEMYFAQGTGFKMPGFDPAAPLVMARMTNSSSCWLEPGVKVREYWPNGGVTEITLGRTGRWHYKMMPVGKPVAYNESWFEDLSKLVEKIEVAEVERLGPYEGYLCK